MPEYDIYIIEEAARKAEQHCSEAAKQGLEGMGLLLGKPFKANGKIKVFISEYITSKNNATAISVKFNPDSFRELSQQMSHEKIVVAWSHSHPGYGCFLSSTDVNTQRKYFNEPYHYALVIDPLKKNSLGFMEKKFFKLTSDGYAEASYAVIRKK